ncbi:MAG: 1-acyl-sn-glycerol-3-phosphate acyltransferase [Pseudomonadales bacterium]|jgi:putative hemolysin
MAERLTDTGTVARVHIIDALIEERATGLMTRPLLWRALKPTLLPLLGYHDAIAAVDRVADMSGLEIFRLLSDQIRMDVQAVGLEHVPERGGAIVMPNHPAGIADGIAVFDALKQVRDDLIFFANRDAIRAAPGLAEMIVPVEWMEEKRSHERRRETVKSMVRAFRDQRLVIIFPSGRLAQPTVRGLRERPWQAAAMNLAFKYGLPVIPMHIRARNSWLYYLFYLLHHELRDITLFRELFNKTGHPYRISIGEPFDPVPALALHGDDMDALTESLRTFVAERMPLGETRFPRTASVTNPPTRGSGRDG